MPITRSKPRDTITNISVYDILGMLSNGMSQEEILDDFPELDREDIMAALAYAADREHQVFSPKVQ